MIAHDLLFQKSVPEILRLIMDNVNERWQKYHIFAFYYESYVNCEN